MDSTCVWPRVKSPEPVYPGQNADFSGEGANFIHAASVHPFPCQEPLFDHFFLHFVQADLNVDVKILVVIGKLFCKVPGGRR